MPAEAARDPGRALLAVARHAIAERLGANTDPDELAAARAALPAGEGASFVTLTRAGALRGCIGTLEARRPLITDVAENALAAAFRDPRFPPLRREEWPGTRVEVSLLAPPEPFVVASEAAAIAALRPGTDGLIFDYGGRRATFLPQVWESLPAPADFLARLKEKAGYPPDFWHPDVRLSRYGVRKWCEDDDEMARHE
ncbi:MAG TPA: AmmeMemoRadiSam system protein A [Rhodocyclaceae bacterium]